MSEVNSVVFTPATFATLNLLTTPLWIFDRHRLQLLWANRAAVSLWQAASLAELLQREFGSLSEALREQWQTYWQQLHQGKPVVEAWLFYQEGHITFVQCHFSRIKLEAGQEAMLVEGKIGSLSQLNSERLQGLEIRCINDPLTGKSVQLILEREVASTEAPVSAALHQPPLTVLTSLPVPVWFSGSDHQLQYVNQAWLSFTGQTLQQALRTAWLSDLHPDDRDRCLSVYWQAFALRQPFTIEHRLRHHDGTYCWVTNTGKPLSDLDGSFSGYVGFCYDITQYKQMEVKQQVQNHTAQLQQALHFESTLKQITDRVRDSLDERLILQTVVQALAVALQVICCDIAIYNEARTTSTICYDYTDGSIPSAQGEVVQMAESYDPALHTQLLQGLCFQFCPLVLNQARPLKEPIAILSCPIVDDQGVLGDMWLSKPMHDLFNELEIRLIQQVTNQTAIAIRQARLYQSAQTQISELDRLNRLKDDFLSTVSHELRSPMANIKMATQMLELVMAKVGLFEQEPSAKQYFGILQEECQRELSLINDLLDLARLDAEVEALRLTPVDLKLLLPHLVEPFAEKAQQQQQQLTLTLSSALPLLTTDVPMLTRVLSELLTNACKYTRAGEKITVTAQLEPDSLQISVANSGIEIPPKELPRIFDKFYRIPNNDPWRHGGTGLGLALVQKLVDRLGATIAVASTANQTTFVVSFPLLA
ncbi:MAG: PAS domain-containing protein [Stenomitos rutilans HA7619-LM2]|jgi:PAS domain S-box-containing protein|nr:PAS domain-containing protein [Stenomitos rutilans HA7619-LM2]